MNFSNGSAQEEEPEAPPVVEESSPEPEPSDMANQMNSLAVEEEQVEEFEDPEPVLSEEPVSEPEPSGKIKLYILTK